MNRLFINPSIPLVDAVTEWLAANARKNAEGVLSLEHILIIVPTSQSGRQLRLALARKFSPDGIIPPHVSMPMKLAVPRDKSLATASKYETAAILMRFLASPEFKEHEWPLLFPHGLPGGDENVLPVISLAEQLEDIWGALSAGGLLMADVPAKPEAREILEAATGTEIERWEELADFEKLFFDALASSGLRHHAKSTVLAASDPEDIPPEIERIVLPALADPTPVLFSVLQSLSARNPSLKTDILIHADEAESARYDDWGRPAIAGWTGAETPSLPLPDEDIILSANAQSLAASAAACFPEPNSNFAPPALGLADSSLYPALEAALLARGYSEINNPERHKLSSSSLGRLVVNLTTLFTESPVEFQTFTSIVRENDFLESYSEDDRAAILKELDDYQNAAIPSEMPESVEEKKYPNLHRALQRICKWRDASAGTSAAEAVLNALRDLFSYRKIGNTPGDREFTAAAMSVRAVFDEMKKGALLALPDSARLALFRKAVTDAVYQLEPESPDVIQTEGWLELAWSPAVNIIVAGFSEGKIPDSVVGHAFLPDSLREALAIESNTRRLARDTFLFSELLRSRQSGGRVKVFVSLSDSAGEIQRPSRLLFMCEREKLPGRVHRLLNDPDAAAPTPSRVLPPNWRLAFPESVPPMPDHLSASAIDTYLKCPFTYYLQYVLKMEPVEEISELGANDFGTFCHEVLDEFGSDEFSRDLESEEDIRKAILHHFEAVRSRRYPNPTLNLILQLEAAKERLLNFARIQAEQIAAGWRIIECEKSIKGVTPFKGLFPTTLKGTIDRIDYNRETGKFCIIDYKTWDSSSKASEKIYSRSRKDIELKNLLGFPSFKTYGNGRYPREYETRWLSVQMAVYRELLEGSDPKYHGNISEFKYAVLASTAAETCFWGAGNDFRIADAIPSARETMKRAFELISAGIFWPPGPSDLWRYSYKKLFLTSPSDDYEDCGWVKYQNRLLSELKGGIEF